jgi:hypothetical protein
LLHQEPLLLHQLYLVLLASNQFLLSHLPSLSMML